MFPVRHATAALAAALFLGASRVHALDLYWDVTAQTPELGGNGNWLTGSTWRSGSANGTLRSWADASNAFFGGTAGTVYVSNGTVNGNVTAGTVTFTTTGYSLLPHGSDSSTSSLTTLAGNIVLGQNVNLTFMQGTTRDRQFVYKGSVTGSKNASLSLAAGGAGKQNQLLLGGIDSTIAVPISITGDSSSYASLLATATGVRISGDIVHNSAATLAIGANLDTDLTLSGKITGTGNVIFSSKGTGGAGQGTVVLSGKSTYTGSTTISQTSSAAVVRLGVSNALPAASPLMFGIAANAASGSLDLNNFDQTVVSLATFASSTTATITNSSKIAGTSVLTINGSADTDFGGRISDGEFGAKVAVVKAGSGKLTLYKDNAYTGTTTISGGTLELRSAGTLESSPVRMAGGTLAVYDGHVAGKVDSVAVVSGASAITASAIGSTASSSANTQKFALGPISRTSGATIDIVTPTTNGLVTTTTANTAGAILGGWATSGTSTWAVVSPTNGAISGFSAFGVDYKNASGTTDFNVSASGNFAATVSAINSLRFNLNAAASAGIGASKLVINSGGILVTSNVGNNQSSITSGTLTSGNGSDLIVHQHNTAATFRIESNLTDNGTTPIGLTKSGNGSLALTGANTYTGTTTVNAGRLLANTPAVAGSATGGGAVVVRNGGQLAGTGKVSGPVTIENGGVLAAGSGSGATAAAGETVGTLTTGAQTWKSGGTLRLKYASGTTAASAGTGYDTVSMPTLNLAGVDPAADGLFKIVVLKTTTGAFNTAQNATLKLATIGTVTLVAGGPAVAAKTDLSQYFALDTSSLGVQNTPTKTHFKIGTGTGGGDLMLFYDAVGQSAPEPTTAVLTLLGGGAVLGRRRRRVR